MDSISYVYISWTIHGMWMIYITFEGGHRHFQLPSLERYIARLAHSRATASFESKMATTQYKMFCVREFIKTELPIAVQRAFRLRFNIQPWTRKSICRWNHQFEQTGCLCKGKSSGRPRVSEENVRRIQDSFEHSPRKSTRRASRERGISQRTVWLVLRRRLLGNWDHPFLINLYISCCRYLFWFTAINKSAIFIWARLGEGKPRPH